MDFSTRKKHNLKNATRNMKFKVPTTAPKLRSCDDSWA